MGKHRTHSHRLKNLNNQKFGRYYVLGFAGSVRGLAYWLCRCECGTLRCVLGTFLRNENNPRSCGCAKPRRQLSLNSSEVNEGKPSAELITFRSAKSRCQSQTNRHYHYYGGRGIEFRFESVQDLIEAVGRRPSNNHTLDRIDNNGHYEAGNVRWTTRLEQGANKRNNIHLTYRGVTHILSEWSRRLSLNDQLVRRRVRRGWCVECSLSPAGQKYCSHIKSNVELKQANAVN